MQNSKKAINDKKDLLSLKYICNVAVSQKLQKRQPILFHV